MKLTVVFVAILLAAATSAHAAPRASSVPGGRSRSIRKIAIYTLGLGYGSISVDLVSRRICAASSRYSPVPGKWGLVEAELAEAEVQRLADLADYHAFRTFAPRAVWFRVYEKDLDEEYPHLYVSWDDKEVAYEVRPNESLDPGACAWVGAVYRQMIAVSAELFELAVKYGSISSNVTAIELDSDKANAYDSELARVLALEKRPLANNQ